jgi:RND family efflux transporter MFP subunit
MKIGLCFKAAAVLNPLIACLCALSALAPSSAAAAPGEGARVGRALDGGRVFAEPARSPEGVAQVTLPAVVGSPQRAHWDLAPHTDGHLVAWRVQVGAAVRAGDPLADLAPYQIIDLRSRVTSLERVLKARAKREASLKAQVSSGAASIATLEEAEVAREEAAAELAQAQAALSARARHGHKPTVWSSPMDGVVTSLRCAPGAHLDAGSPCLTLSDTTQRVIEVRAPAATLAAATLGQRALWRPARPLPGEPEEVPLVVGRLSPPEERNAALARVVFEPAEGAALPSTGVAGVVTLVGEAPEGAVWVPRGSLTEWGGVGRVFVVDEGAEEARAVEVRVLGEIEGGVVVQGAGLSVGGLVVTRGAFLLKSRALLRDEEE